MSDFEFAEVGWEDQGQLGQNVVWNDSYLQEHQGGRYARNETFAVDDIRTEGLSQCHVEILEQFQIRSYATAPIFVGQRLWGVLAAYQHSKPRCWQPLDLRFLAQVATQLGFAVKQASLLSDTEQRANELQVMFDRQQILFRLITKIRESLDLDTLFTTTATEVRKALKADRVGVFQFQLDSHYCDGEFVAESVVPGFCSVLGVQVHDQCFGEKYLVPYKTGRIQVISALQNANLHECHIRLLQQFQIQAQVLVPIVKDQMLWGLLCIHQCNAGRDWQSSEIDFIKQVATHFSVALKHSDLLTQSQTQSQQLAVTLASLQSANEQLETLTRLDSLTQIANRRYFDEFLQQEWDRLLRQKRWLSLILFDIDHFKAYNDCYGHPAGDRCLKYIAQEIQALLSDAAALFARYGGEEFAVILPETDQTGAVGVAETIQRLVQSLQIQQCSSISHQAVVTISLGVVSQIPQVGQSHSPKTLISAADEALYRAKANGRNQCIVYSPNTFLV